MNKFQKLNYSKNLENEQVDKSSNNRQVNDKHYTNDTQTYILNNLYQARGAGGASPPKLGRKPKKHSYL